MPLLHKKYKLTLVSQTVKYLYGESHLHFQDYEPVVSWSLHVVDGRPNLCQQTDVDFPTAQHYSTLPGTKLTG